MRSPGLLNNFPYVYGSRRIQRSFIHILPNKNSSFVNYQLEIVNI